MSVVGVNRVKNILDFDRRVQLWMNQASSPERVCTCVCIEIGEALGGYLNYF